MTVALGIAAGACIAYAFFSQVMNFVRVKRGYGRGVSGRETVGAIAAAVVLLALAAAVEIVDDKVADPSPPDTTEAPAPDYFANELSNFAGAPRLRAQRVVRPMCLVRYYARKGNRDPGANWWTTCKFNTGLESVAEVRKRLALPKAWGKRNARVIAHIPADESIVYMRGRAARQCEPDSTTACYPGGGEQLLFRGEDFDRSWFVRYECTSGPEREKARFATCPD